MKVSPIDNAQSQSAPAFRAEVAPAFIKRAQGYYNQVHNPVGMMAFNLNVEKFKHFGNDSIKIVYEKKDKKSHFLFAKKGDGIGDNCVVLTEKDCLRKLLEKFMHINEYEFNKKTEVFRQ